MLGGMLRVIDPRQAGETDIVGIGEDLDPATLVWAYAHGIFPWPMDNTPLLWFCPAQRAVLRLCNLHIPESLQKARKRTTLTFTVDRAFGDVIEACRHSRRPGGNGTWITPRMCRAYKELHRLGHAHSVEAWSESGELAGGLYGVDSGGVFTGESMFHRTPNASKLSLLHLAERLRAAGIEWIDIQTMTPHMKVLGAEFIPRNDYLDLADRTRLLGRRPFAQCPK